MGDLRLRLDNEEQHTFAYTERDVILYALSVGAHNQQYVYESSPGFQALPSFGIIAAFGATDAVPLHRILPNFDHVFVSTRRDAGSGNPAFSLQPLKRLLLHGEHYMRLERPLPTAGQLCSRARVVDILDKGRAAVVVLGIDTNDEDGRRVCYNEVTYFIRGSGGFGNVKRVPPRRDAAATALNDVPAGPPDFSTREKTQPWQAALYRLNGDLNPLHIDPEVAATAHFPRPILHGLCTLGISVKHVLQMFGAGTADAAQSIKVRFSGHVFPGETLCTDAWQTNEHTVVFKTSVVERGAVAISQAAVVFRKPVQIGEAKSQQAAAKL